jgi:L-histidine Nalpha-methyltransferase
MTSVAKVLIHASQLPENVRRDLVESLRTRRVNHKFHYDSVRQTQKWLALHQAYSPSRHDADYQAVYEQDFKVAAAKIKTPRVHVIGLGCGGGQKDTQLLKLLKARGREIFYTPCDVSTAMVLVARRTALAVVPEKNCFPFVCDLATADDLPDALSARPSSLVPRLLTFFGMIPNFEPQIILPKLASLIRKNDFLLFSANLAPGNNYAAGMKKVLPQYDNPLTRDWLMPFLLDLGVGRNDGEMRFKIETCSSQRLPRRNMVKTGEEAPTSRSISAKKKQGLLTSSPAMEEVELKRIVADFHFTRRCRIEVANKVFDFRAGESIRLFFSYRYTPERVRKVLTRYGLEVCDQWITSSEEEGVFLVERRSPTRRGGCVGVHASACSADKLKLELQHAGSETGAPFRLSAKTFSSCPARP